MNRYSNGSNMVAFLEMITGFWVKIRVGSVMGMGMGILIGVEEA